MINRTTLPALFALTTLAFHPAVAQEAGQRITEQRLAPTKAAVVRPADWFYTESHRGPALTWTISKENTKGGKPYRTGVMIQAFYGIEKVTKKSPEQFVKQSIEQRKKTKGVVVSKAADEVAIGPCKMLRLLTEENGDVILHEYYYGTGDLDAVVVVIRGAPEEEWPKVQQSLAIAGRFDLRQLITFQPKSASAATVPKDDLTEPLTKLGYTSVEMTREPSGLPVVSVRINDGKPLRFVCDTGANVTVIAPEAAKTLNLSLVATTDTAAGLGGAKKSMTARIAKLQIGDTVTGGQTLVVTDVSQLNKQFAVAGGNPVDGFLGSDWMREHQAVVDVSRNKLFFKNDD